MLMDVKANNARNKATLICQLQEKLVKKTITVYMQSNPMPFEKISN